MPSTKSELFSKMPLVAQFDGNSFVVGGGVAIFHVATGRVVVCSLMYRGQVVYFLPKGRRDAGEESGRGAEREGYEEYVIYWYVAETLPPDAEVTLETQAGDAYKLPPSYPQGLSLKERIKQEPEGYEPRHHENTGVDAEERTYKSELMSVEEAVNLLRAGYPSMGCVMADVVLKGWEGIQQRFAMEDAATHESPEAV
ncbi:hypothetical protein CFE70_002559 [Pyrenophora teres f. teres 0-1]